MAEEQRTKRFKYKSYKEELKDVHLPSALNQNRLENDDVEESDSLFHLGLDHWRQLNLSPSFLNFANDVKSLSLSMPLLLHNWREVVKLWIEAVNDAKDEGFKALLDLLQKLLADLRTTLLPVYPTILSTLLSLLPKLISAEALSVLLSTLAALFKSILVPSLQDDTMLLEETWTEMCSTLKKCLPEIQTAVADVLGAFLRRLKGNVIKEKAMVLLAENLQDLESVGATALVYACKSVSQTLHTGTISLFKPLLLYHLTASATPDLTHTLIRRSLTALMHHVKSADQFSPLAELVIGLFDSTLKQYVDQGPSCSQYSVPLEEQLRRSLEVVAVPCSVRQGSRLRSSDFEQLFSLFPLMSLKLVESHSTTNTPMQGAFMRFTTSLYLASEMALWLGPGRNFMAHSWDEAVSSYSKQLHADVNADMEMESSASSEQASTAIESPTSFKWGLYTRFIFPFHSCLAELSWGGWKLVALPLVLKHTLQLFSKITDDKGDVTMSRVFLAFLATLRRGKKLSPSEVDVVWRERLEKWSLGRLSNIGQGSDKNTWPEEETAEFNDILALSPFLSATFSKSLLHLVNKTFNQTSASTNARSAWVIGRCLETLADRDPAEWSTDVDIGVWTSTVAEGWAWSADVLSGLVAVSRVISTNLASVTLADVYPSFRNSIISHSRRLRLEALRLLDLPHVATTKSAQGVIKRCLQGEEASLDFQGMRERMVCVSRVVQIVGDEEDADIAARWLIAQLKVNLRPIWSATAEAIASFSQTYGDLVWRLLFEQLTGVALKGEAVGVEDSAPTGHSESSESASRDRDVLAEERSWRDSYARKLRSVVAKWINNPDVLLGELRQSLPKHERFDAQSYEAQLLATLGCSPSLAEKHNRELVSFFLSLTRSSSQDSGNQDDDGSIVLVPKLILRPKLTAYLTLFSKFSNPKALYATGTLYTLYISLLSHPDRALQTVALTCILTYKSGPLVPHEEKLRLLLDDTRWRDELTTFDMNVLEPTDRKEVVDVLTRLLFGRMLERRGRAQGADRRTVVLAALAGLDEEELGLLVELMLTPLGIESKSSMKMDVDGPPEWCLKTSLVDFDALPEKQQIGFLTLLGDVLKNLGTRLTIYWPVLIHVVVDLVSQAHKKITALAPSEEAVEQPEEGELLEPGPDDDNEEKEDSETPLSTHTVKVHRSIRQLGLKRFADFFRSPVYFDFSPFLQFSFASFISPRLTSLDTENTQAPSALLELFFAWTHDSAYVRYLVDYDSRTLPKVYDCLIATNVKPAVISRVFDIVDRLLEYSTTVEEIREQVLKPHVSLLLTNLSILVERTNVTSVSTPLVQRQINILSSIAQYLTDEVQASTLVTLLVPLLRKPAKDVPERVKVDLVKIIGQIMPRVSGIQNPTSVVYEKVYTTLSLLFQSLRSRHGRTALVSTFRQLANIDHSLENLASLMESLNSFSTKRVEEPDFGRRLTAFANLNENLYKTLGATDWLPVLYNSLHFIQDNDELAIRSNASLAMRRFIDFVASAPSSEFEQVFLRVLFPKLKHGLKSKSELVRAEVLGVLGYAVARCEQVTVLNDMQVLLAGGDEEASFFANVLHVQVHRRSRALRRLAEFSNEGRLRSSLLAEIFVPLVENFIVSSTSVDHHLLNDAIHVTGRMARQLSWRPYYALVQKYIKFSKAKDESERTYIRTLVAILDNFHFPMEDEVQEPEKIPGDEDEEAQVPDEMQILAPGALKATARIAEAVSLRLLPTLLDHLEKHDPTTDDNARLPISIGIVNVARHLPSSSRELQIGRLLTILSQILRSHSQETRDLTREALQRIAVILGSAYLPQIMRELRAALTRGPQLHVLAFVTHALLVHVTSDDHAKDFGSLDESVSDIAYVSAEVIFGDSGKDVQAEEFKTKMREVRASSSKGFDSFGIAARFVAPHRISTLLAPLRAIMQETESAKVMNLADEVLKRVASGLNSNKHLVPKELIVLCHTLITQNAKFLQQVPSRHKSKFKAKSDVIVQAKRDVAVERDHYANNSYRFVAFGLDLLHTALRRSRFDFHDSDVMNRLNSMIVVIGNTLYSTSTPVLILGLRCAAGLAKCPLPSLGKSLPVFVNQALDIIKQTGNTEAEVVQVAFKTLATILRDGPAVHVKEKDLIFLLELLIPDIEEPSRQASVFAMLRAIVARKFVVPEIYDAMTKVAEIMVTSQSMQVQELCRGVLLQFLLDYPQGKGRLRTQMAFLAKNLSYVYESGRKSVMEFINAVISKFQIGLISDYADLFFIALVMVVANDDSPQCREMAAHLIKTLFTRLDDDRRGVLFSHLHSWATQRDQPHLARVSSQVYGFIVEALQGDVKSYANLIIEDLKAALENGVQQWKREEDDDDDAMQVEIEWQVPYHSLSVLFKVARTLPDSGISGAQIPWGLVSSYLTFPHAWVRMASSRLLGLLFSAAPMTTPRQDLPDRHPLSTVGMRDVAEKMCSQLRSQHLDEALSLQVVKNLFFIGKCLYCLPIEENKEDVRVDIDESANNRSRQEERKRNDPLPWLFTKLSYQIRSAYIARTNKSDNPVNWHLQPLAVLRWFAAMASFMEPSRLEKFLVHILSPLYRLIEDDMIRDGSMDEIKTLAIELQDLVQNKVGAVKFSNVYNHIRQSVLTTRRERKEARAIHATVDPVAAAKRKLQRNVTKKMSKKRKDRAFA
ncbi:Armadillo-type fold [Amanita muscaria]